MKRQFLLKHQQQANQILSLSYDTLENFLLGATSTVKKQKSATFLIYA
jgi:hypothetical protein